MTTDYPDLRINAMYLDESREESRESTGENNFNNKTQLKTTAKVEVTECPQ